MIVGDNKTEGYTPPAPLKLQGSTDLRSTATQTTNGFLPKNASITFQDVTDGLSNTIAVWESGGRPLVYRLGSPVDPNPQAHRVNAGGWVRPATDIILAGSNKSGSLVVGHGTNSDFASGIFLNKTNGVDIGQESYAPGTNGGYVIGSPVWGTEGTSQPYSFHPGGLNVLLGDGAVKFLDEGTHIGIAAASPPGISPVASTPTTVARSTTPSTRSRSSTACSNSTLLN